MNSDTYNNGMMAFDGDAFAIQGERAQNMALGKPQGSNAGGYTKKIIECQKKAQDKIRKDYYKDNPEGFQQYLEANSELFNKQIQDAWQYEQSQIIHGAVEDNDRNLVAQFAGLTEGLNNSATSAYFGTAAALERNTIETQARIGNQSLESSDIPATKENGLDVERAKETADIHTKSIRNIDDAGRYFNERANACRVKFSDTIAKIHRGQYDHAVKVLGFGHDSAIAFANTQVNKNVKKMVQDVISTNPEYAKQILSWLGRADATRVQEVDKDGNPLFDEVDEEKDGKKTGKKVQAARYMKNVWNPIGRWCLSAGEVAELSLAADKQILEYVKIKNAGSAVDAAARKELDDRLDRAADEVERQARRFFYTSLYTSDDPYTSAKKYLDMADNLKKQGYKDSGRLYDTILNAANEVYTLRKNAEERVKKQGSQASLDEYMAQLDQYRVSSADNVMMSFMTPYGIRQQNKEGTERRAAIIAVGEAILRNGDIPDSQRSQLKADIDSFKKEKVENDCATLEKMARDIGFVLPQEQTKSMFIYRQQAHVTVDDAPSRQTGDSVLFNKDGLVLMGNEMTITWRDANGNTIDLGKNEAQKVFRRMFHIISQTPVDELSNPEAYKRLSGQFAREIGVVAKDKDVNRRYERLMRGFDKLENTVFGTGHWNTLRNISLNYRTPQQHMRYNEMRRKLQPVVENPKK